MARLGNVIAMRGLDGAPLAFHTSNLELAQISEEAFSSLQEPELNPNSEAIAELKLWNETPNISVRNGELKYKPRSISLNVTQICNLHCTYCAAGGDGTYGSPIKKVDVEKTIPQLNRLLENTDSGLVHINFIGGEPLLYPDAILAIGRYLKQEFSDRNVAIKYVITTNGTLLNEKILQLLIELQAFVNVSFDGPPEVNDKRRPNKAGEGSSFIVLENLKVLAARKNSLGGLGVTAVLDKNFPHVFEAWKFLRTLNTDWLEFNFSHTEKDPIASQIYRDEMRLIASAAYELGGERELRRIKAFDHYFHQLDEQQRVENFCGAGKSLLMIDAKNDVYPCPWMVGDKTQLLGNVNSMDAQALKKFEAPLIAKIPCTNCWAKYLCGGGCMFIHKNRTGKLDQVDPAFCDRTKDLIANTIMYYELSRRGNEV